MQKAGFTDCLRGGETTVSQGQMVRRHLQLPGRWSLDTNSHHSLEEQLRDPNMLSKDGAIADFIKVLP